MSPDDDADRDEEDLRVLLADLETTLSALREDLSTEGSRRGRADDAPPDGRSRTVGESGDLRPGTRRYRPGRTPPRPPSLTELFRFTEQYTLPTVISLLEATIQSLELLRGVLRVADPDRSALDSGDRSRRRSGRSRLGDDVARVGRDAVSGVGREAVSGVERTLSELQTALSESDVPSDDTSRELLEDAQRLSEEVTDRLAETRQADEADRYGYRRTDRERTGPDAAGDSDAVTIDVSDDRDEPQDRDGNEDDDRGAGDRKTDEDRSEPTQIDVEAELASIKDEVEPRNRRDGVDSGSESTDTEGKPSDAEGDAGDKGDDDPREDEDTDAGDSDDSER